MLDQSQLITSLESLLRAPVRLLDAGLLDLPSGLWHAPHVVAAPKLILVSRGSIRYEINGLAISLKEGGMLFRPAFTSASWVVGSEGPGQLMYVELANDLDAWPNFPLWVGASDLETERASFDRLRHLYFDPDESARMEIEGELKAILARFFRRASQAAGGQQPPVRGRSGSAGEAAVRGAVAWLARHFTDASPLHNLHERVGLSEDHFRRIFRKRLGQNAQQYLHRLRMGAAKAYLERSSLSVKEIARAVGYHDPLYFSRAFHKTFGRTPSQDRQRATQED